MNRRDLLFLRPASGAQVYELACERLYMQYLDARRPAMPPPADADGCWLGEPEPQYDVRSVRELFAGLREDVNGAQLLRIVEPHWLVDSDLRCEVEALADLVRAAGGRVEFVSQAGGGHRTQGQTTSS